MSEKIEIVENSSILTGLEEAEKLLLPPIMFRRHKNEFKQ
jgi:hypothetical protein